MQPMAVAGGLAKGTLTYLPTKRSMSDFLLVMLRRQPLSLGGLHWPIKQALARLGSAARRNLHPTLTLFHPEAKVSNAARITITNSA